MNLALCFGNNFRSAPSAPARLTPAPRQLSATASLDLFDDFVGEFSRPASIQVIDALLHVRLELLEPDRLLPFVILEQPQPYVQRVVRRPVFARAQALDDGA